MKTLLAGLALLIAATAQAGAHEVLHTTATGRAVIVELTYGNGTPFSFESYELSRPGEKIPAQVGRSDSRGRIVFIPDTSGAWRVRAFSEDGHGADFTVDIDTDSLAPATPSHTLALHERILIGIGFILGIFGVISITYRERKQR